MTRIADIVGVHETTVSRAIANKYIKTPHGVFEFKYFFTPGYQAESGAVGFQHEREGDDRRPGGRRGQGARPSATRISSASSRPRGSRSPGAPSPSTARSWASCRATCGATTPEARLPGSQAQARLDPQRRRRRVPPRPGRPRPRSAIIPALSPVCSGRAASKGTPARRAASASAARNRRLLATPPDRPRLRKAPRARAAALLRLKRLHHRLLVARAKVRRPSAARRPRASFPAGSAGSSSTRKS